MLRRNLREDRHPSRAAEVRENLVPRISPFFLYWSIFDQVQLNATTMIA